MTPAEVLPMLLTAQALCLGWLGVSSIMLHRRLRAIERSPLMNRPGWVAGQPVDPSVVIRENGSSRRDTP